MITIKIHIFWSNLNSDAIISKPNIKEIDQPKDVEMDDISGFKSKTIDLTSAIPEKKVKIK